MAKAMNAWGEWNPDVRRCRRRSLVLVDSIRPWDRPCSSAASIASRWRRMRTGAAEFTRRDTVAEVQATGSGFERQTIYRCLRRLAGHEPGSAHRDLEDLGNDQRDSAATEPTHTTVGRALLRGSQALAPGVNAQRGFDSTYLAVPMRARARGAGSLGQRRESFAAGISCRPTSIDVMAGGYPRSSLIPDCDALGVQRDHVSGASRSAPWR